MILFHAKRDGTVTTTPDLVPQGSSMQDLVVVSEFDYAYCAIRLLPASGEYIEDVPCTPILQRDFSTIFTAALPSKATVVAGSVDYQLVFTAADGTTQTTLVGSFTVPRGVPASTPPTVGELSSKTVGDLYDIIDNVYTLFAGHEGNIYKNTKDVAALKEKITTAGTVTIPTTEWTDFAPTVASVKISDANRGSIILMLPADEETRLAANSARLSAYPTAFAIADGSSSVTILRAEAEKAPAADMTFAYAVIKTGDDSRDPKAAILGVDAYGEGGGTASGVDETAVKKIINSLLGNVDNVRQYSADNPPPYPVTSVNGKTGAVSLSIPSKAADVGADPAGTASSKLTTHNVDTASHEDLRLELQRLADRLNAALNSDDTSLDDLKEIVAYIKSNKTLIDGITSSKVNVTDIVNNLTTNTANVPLSASQGVALKLLIDSLEEIVEGKVTAEQVDADIANALKGYQPAGDYLTPTAAAPIINTEVDKVVTERKEELRGEPGKDGETPEAGVDYPTVEQVDRYIAAELAKRNQFVPIPAASVEDMTDITKIYYLATTGELYAYAPTQVAVGGYTNLADPASSDWNADSRLNSSGAVASSSYDKGSAFVSNKILVRTGQKIYIKNVKTTTSTSGGATQFAAVFYNSEGTIVNASSQPYLLKKVEGSGFSVTANNQAWDAVISNADGSYEWEAGKNNAGEIPNNVKNNAVSCRISGLATSSYDDVIITVDEPIVEPTIETVYKWAGTGHFISSEEAITALESRVNDLEDKHEQTKYNLGVLSSKVDKLPTGGTAGSERTIFYKNLDIEHIVNAACKVGEYTAPLWSLLITTDLHNDPTRFASAVSYLNAMGAIKAGICLGDIQSSNAASGADAWYAEEVAKSTKPWYTALGNHDVGHGTDASTNTTPTGAFTALIEPTIDKIGVTNLTTPYYGVADDEHGIYLIVLNCHDVPDDKGTDGNYIVPRQTVCFGQEQINWFVAELAAIPTGYHLVVAVHNFSGDVTKDEGIFTRDLDDFITVPNGYSGSAIIADIVAAWISGSSITKSYAPKLYTDTLPTLSVSANFSARGAGILVAHINGHYHYDAVGHYTAHPEQTVISLCATCATPIQNQVSDLPRALGTKAEDAITVMAVDTASKQIRLVRVGSNYTDELEERTYAVIEYGTTT